MLLRTPDFYEKFHCIADKCTDTCCVGWEIDVDKASLAKYKAACNAKNSNEIDDAFARKLQSSIRDGHFVLESGDRCPFLDKCGLCEIYRHLGEGALCDICREHPRFVDVYGDIKEQGIGLCCEEGVRFLLEKQNPANNAAPEDANSAAPVMRFIESEVNDIPDELPDDALEARDQIFAEREKMFAILSQHEIPLSKRLQMLLEYAVEVSGTDEGSSTDSAADIHASNATDITKIYNKWIEILGKGESIGPAWDKAYKAISENGWRSQKSHKKGLSTKAICHESLLNDEDGARIVAYTLFRYYAKSLFDGDSLGKVQFAIFFWIVLREFGQELADSSYNGGAPGTRIIDPRIAAVKLLSKQVEYSDEVMDSLADAFVNNENFCIGAFIKILNNNMANA